MDMDGMSMVFMTSTTTPLFSSHWTPATLGQYAGTCIFLIVLAFIFRFLLAWKHVQEHTWARRNTELNRLTIATTTTPSIGDSMDEKEAQTQQVVTEKTVVAEGWGGRPWRFSTDLARAAMTTMITGVGYLL
jgi:copper transporter 1